MGSAEKFCLRWNDFESNISVAFRELREDKDFFDITLACDDDQIQAHKVILSACSPFFRSVLRKNPHQHPLLYLKGVKYADLLAVLNFMYHGEVNVAQDELNSFLAVAEDLRVKGLTQNNAGASDKSSKPEPTPLPKPRQRDPPERPDPGPPPKRPRPPPSAPSQDARSSSSYQNDDDDIQEVIPVKSEPVSHTEQNNTVAMAPPPDPPYDTAGAGHGVVADPGADNSMYGDDEYGDYDQYGEGADGSFDGSMMEGMAGSASADGNKDSFQLSSLLERYMSKIPDEEGKKAWQCSFVPCKKIFKRKHNCKEHIEAHHLKGAVEHKCNLCHGVYSTEASFRQHTRNKHSQPKPLSSW